jgi:hypothetical protein
MTTIPETLRQASEALQQASAALVATAQTMEDAPTPAAEPEPGEWRNDRAPKGYEADHQGLVWTWTTRGKVLTPVSGVKRDDYWALGHRPAPKSPPPGVVGSREVEMEPGEWQDDGPPTGEDEGILGCVWCFRGGQPALTNAGEVRLLYAHRCCQWWAPGNRPAPTTTPRDVVVSRLARAGAEPFKSPTNGWIVDRPPTRKDADIYGFILVPDREDAGAKQIHLDYVHPGTPWARTNSRLYPWDPTCLDRNGWIRSRLPTVEDANGVGVVLIPVGNGGTTATINYHLIVPGQPWAPWDSNPGGFEK